MKKLQLSILAIASLLNIQTINAQTVDEVVNKHIEAMGGKEKLLSLKTLKMEGTMNAMGQDVAITLTKSHLVGQRVDISVMGMTGYQLNTPTQGMGFMPFGGQTEPKAWPEEQVKSSFPQLDLQGTFVNYKEKGTQLELQGKETTEGEECNKIKATFKNGTITTYFISTKTNYIVKTSGMRNIGGEEKEISTVFSNYKPTAEGYIFANTTVTTNGEINYEKIEVNKPVDEKLFTAN